MNNSHIGMAFLQCVLGYESSMDLIVSSSMDSMGTKIIFEKVSYIISQGGNII